MLQTGDSLQHNAERFLLCHAEFERNNFSYFSQNIHLGTSVVSQMCDSYILYKHAHTRTPTHVHFGQEF